MDINELAAKDWFKCSANGLELSDDKPQIIKRNKKGGCFLDYQYIETVDRKLCLCWSVMDNAVMITKINSGAPLLVSPMLFRSLREVVKRWNRQVKLSRESFEKSNLAQVNQLKFDCDELVFDIIM